MKRIELLYLSQEDVISIGITMEETILIVEDALKEHGLGETENPPKPGVHPKNAFIHAMPGYLPRKKAAGLKWVSSFSSNISLAIPPVMGLFILNDVQTGQPLAVMDCRWITAMRTGAASAVAAKFLGFPEEEILKNADVFNCDAIIMGAHEKGIAHTFLGTVAKRVLRRSRKPVFIIPLPKGQTDTSFDDDD